LRSACGALKFLAQRFISALRSLSLPFRFSAFQIFSIFSPELTGRENIFLNGAILGMRKSLAH
jgi:hypothetical protein